MKKLLFAVLLIGVAVSYAAAEFFIVPDGIIAPDGRLSYAAPIGSRFGQGDCPYPGGPGPLPYYPVYYPELRIPALMLPESLDQRPAGDDRRR